MTDAAPSFPRLAARTLNFQLGLPRDFVVSRDGERVAFLRADSGTSRSHGLCVYDVGEARERLVADPASLLDTGEEQLTAEERARRERQRVRAAGVVAFSTDAETTYAAFAISSRLFVASLADDKPPRELATASPVVDPQIDPTGRFVAYAADRGVRIVTIETGADELLVEPGRHEPDEVVWGLAEFAAAEELDRSRGFWWAPDGESLLVERYDESPVQVWYIADPAHPDREPVAVRYPQAGTANAVVSLSIVPRSGERCDVQWKSDRPVDGETLEYLAAVEWGDAGPLLTLLSRDQKRMEFRSVDVATGATTLLRAITDDVWVELMPGTPKRLPDGRLLHGTDVGSTRHLAIDGEPFTPPGLQVRTVEALLEDAAIATVISGTGAVSLARLGFDGQVDSLSDPTGYATGTGGGETVVVSQRMAADVAITTSMLRAGERIGEIGSVAERPPFNPNLEILELGPRRLHTAVLFPAGHVRGSRRLPVLMDPYGGPHGQRVVASARAHLQSQWFADQGFVVVVADGRGVDGRGPEWDRLARNDFVGTIDDQVEALQEVAAAYPDDVDASRVGIRGWSFGGYLAALGVLKRPDVFGAAVAGAPVTDMRLYDTCYTERYLGRPDESPDVYEANSLLPLAPRLSRPLMLIHGLADDNVLVAHTLQLSSALLAAGRPHEVLPLSGMTHMADSEVVAENLLLLQVDFLRRALDLAPAGD